MNCCATWKFSLCTARTAWWKALSVVSLGITVTYSSIVSHFSRPQAAAEAILAIFCWLTSEFSLQLSLASSYSDSHSPSTSRHRIWPRMSSTSPGLCSRACPYARRALSQSCSFSYQRSFTFRSVAWHLVA
uniref:Putative secreted protein n=1 Tax=Ixodes ricinus TaxID=34613 RepID=A0A6B0UR95_IXORI